MFGFMPNKGFNHIKQQERAKKKKKNKERTTYKQKPNMDHTANGATQSNGSSWKTTKRE